MKKANWFDKAPDFIKDEAKEYFKDKQISKKSLKKFNEYINNKYGLPA